MTGVHIWLDRGGSRLYVKLADRMENRDFHGLFLRPLRTLGFRFDPAAVAHYIEADTSQECCLLVRQLEASFDVSRLEKQEIFYWLGAADADDVRSQSQSQLRSRARAETGLHAALK